MPKAIESICRLSPQQFGMLLESLDSRTPGLHIEQHVFPIDPRIEIGRYRKAWELLLDRHSVLRTAFVWKDGAEPIQATLSGVKLPFEEHDCDAHSAADYARLLQSFIEQDRRQGFDLSKPPLMRIAVFRRTGKASTGVWTHHHILLDGWSLPVLKRELEQIFRALSTGLEPALPPVSQYRDYVAWLGQQDASAAETFWRNTLSGFKRPTPLGLDSTNTEFMSNAEGHGHLEAALPEPWPDRIRRAAAHHGITVNTVVQGVWSLLLRRYSGRGDLVFGTTVSGRPPELPGVESMVGLFINTVPFRVEVPPGGSVWEWMHRLQDGHAAVRQHEYWSTGQIHSWSQLPGALPLFESVLVFENYPVAAPASNGNAAPGFVGAHTKYPLTVLIDAAPAFTIHLVYDGRRIPSHSIRQVAGHWLLLLRAIAGGHAECVDDLVASIPESEIPHIRPRRTPAERDSVAIVPPRTAAEAVLIEIWRELLGVPVLGTTDNFFAFGGHSLLATMLVSRVRDTFQLDVTLKQLFDRPTIEQLAVVIEDLLVEEVAQLDDEEAQRLAAASITPESS